MWQDPIVAEVRKIRLEIEAECEGDWKSLFARALEIQAQFADKVVSQPQSLQESTQTNSQV